MLGVTMVLLFGPLHECIHQTAFRTRALNRGVAWICGLLLLTPPLWFRQFHFAHHRHTQMADSDPELNGRSITTLAQYGLYMSGMMITAFALKTIVSSASGKPTGNFISASVEHKVVREARIFVGIYTLVLSAVIFGDAPFIAFWFIPLLIAEPMRRLWLLAEHHGCGLNRDPTSNTRTTNTNAAMRFLTWQMTYHTAHHAYPACRFTP